MRSCTPSSTTTLTSPTPPTPSARKGAHDDETAVTAVGVLRRAVDWFAARGITTERVLTDNESAYVSSGWR